MFETDQLHSLAMLFLDAHQYGIYIWGIFFGLHLIALGYLVIKSQYAPKIIGVLMMVGSVGYAIEGLTNIFFSDSEVMSILVPVLLVIAVAGELSFTFYLLIKGDKIYPRPT